MRCAAFPAFGSRRSCRRPIDPSAERPSLTPTPVTARAGRLGLPVLKPGAFGGPEAVEALRDLRPDLVVLADYGQLIPRVLLDLPPRGFLNLHPSGVCLDGEARPHPGDDPRR